MQSLKLEEEIDSIINKGLNKKYPRVKKLTENDVEFVDQRPLDTKERLKRKTKKQNIDSIAPKNTNFDQDSIDIPDISLDVPIISNGAIETVTTKS